jgi:photosystem II stability/assembly factor-like uncharacterized protein
VESARSLSAAGLAAAAVLSVAGAKAGGNAPVAVVIIHGNANAVFATRDGRTWRNVTPRQLLFSVEDVTFVDASRGWLVTGDCARGKARLYRTSDGGGTWSSKPSSIFTHSCNAGARVMLDLLTRRAGFAAVAEPTGPGESLYGTADGGTTWKFVHDLPSVGEIRFRTARDSWLGGLHLYHSRDGGRSWRPVRLPRPPGHGDPELPSQFAVPTFHGSHALVAGAFPRGKRLVVRVYATRDRGRRWRIVGQFAPSWSFYWPAVTMRQPSRRVAWIATPTTTPMLYVTQNGGRRWLRHRLPFRVGRIQALDATTAIATTFSGRVRVTHDAGATWRKPSFPEEAT